MSSSATQVVGGGFGGLVRAARLARAGTSVDYLEPALHAGGLMQTESFLTPFRFNLGPCLVLRDVVGAAWVIEPDPILSVGGTLLGRQPVTFDAGSTAVEALEGSELAPGTRATLLGLALLGGLDPQAPGSGRELAFLARRLPDLVAVAAGNGLVAARLGDEIVANGGRVIEGFGRAASRRRKRRDGLGVSRLFLGLRRNSLSTPAFATAFGWRDAPELLARLDRLRTGEPAAVGLLLRNAHLDPTLDGLTSYVWQGVLAAGTKVDRAAHVRAVLDAIEVEDSDVLFALLWGPEETGEYLRGRSCLRPSRL